MIDWSVIRQEYEQGASLRSLATKHSVSKTYIIEKRNKEDWNRPTTDRPLTDHPTPKKSDTQREAIQAIFLAAFEKSANVSESCKAAGIHRSTVYDWLEKYETFSILYHQAEQIANDAIRAEIFRRGHDGIEEPVLNQGQLVYEYEPVLDEFTGEQKKDDKGKLMWKRGKMVTMRKYSDVLLIFLAKARMPEFREKQSLEVTTPGSVEVYKVRIPDNGRDS